MTDYALLESGEREKEQCELDEQCELEPKQLYCRNVENNYSDMWFVLLLFYSFIFLYEIDAMQALTQQIKLYNNANDGIPD